MEAYHLNTSVPHQMKDRPLSSVSSNQNDVHDALANLVDKHRGRTWREPTPAHSRSAAARIGELLENHGGPLILDSFCGTGMSTATLAEQYPHALVIGVDKSESRLSKHKRKPADNYHLVRASCEHVWSELSKAGITCERHYLLYPNPWPKKAHLKRRIHGHPAFPILRTLGGIVELRSNWFIYVQEFANASRQIDFKSEISSVKTTAPWTLFEQKYLVNNEHLWRCVCTPTAKTGVGRNA